MPLQVGLGHQLVHDLSGPLLLLCGRDAADEVMGELAVPLVDIIPLEHLS